MPTLQDCHKDEQICFKKRQGEGSAQGDPSGPAPRGRKLRNSPDGKPPKNPSVETFTVDPGTTLSLGALTSLAVENPGITTLGPSPRMQIPNHGAHS